MQLWAAHGVIVPLDKWVGQWIAEVGKRYRVPGHPLCIYIGVGMQKKNEQGKTTR